MNARLREYLVPPGATLRDVLRSLDQSGVQIALVVEGDDRFVGTVTDGDVRRALLAGADLEAPVARWVQREPIAVGPEVGRVEILDLMRARGVQEVPIIGGDGRVIGLHLLAEIIGAAERPHWAVVMAGGRGARLRPLTDGVPKPMLPVAGRPILERIVLHLVGFGVRRIFLAVHYKQELIEHHFGDGSAFGCRIEYLREPSPLGSGGALSLLPEAPAEPLLVMNGDLVTQADVGAMLDYHERGGFAATVGVRPYQHRVPFGSVEVDDGRIRRFEEKPVITRLINAGVYVISTQLPGRVPAGDYPITRLIEDCLDRGEPVGAFSIDEEWIDVGHVDQLRAARGALDP